MKDVNQEKNKEYAVLCQQQVFGRGLVILRNKVGQPEKENQYINVD